MVGRSVGQELQREVLYERDPDGGAFAIEVVWAPTWDEALLRAPDDEDADVRGVLLGAGRPPGELPAWLGVEPVSRQLAEARPGSGAYAAPLLSRPQEDAARNVGQRLWAALGPAHDGAPLGDFLAAGAAAARHPAPVPAEAARRLRVLVSFCRGRARPLGRVADLNGAALEWWLARRFGTPDAFADAILLERLREQAPEVATVLLALRAATVPDDAPAFAELALDRRALLSQATPWRYFEVSDMAPALAAVRSWLRRYTTSFEAHAASIRTRAAELRLRIERELRAVRALERLDAIAALGEPVGSEATVAVRTALRTLVTFEPTAALAPLGAEPALFAEAHGAMARVRVALERQRERLAAATVRVILDRPDADALQRLLQAIQASDLDGIERALSPRLAAHIEELLESAPASPLAALAARYPEVDATNLDEVVGALRALLGEALAAAPGSRIALA